MDIQEYWRRLTGRKPSDPTTVLTISLLQKKHYVKEKIKSSKNSLKSLEFINCKGAANFTKLLAHEKIIANIQKCEKLTKITFNNLSSIAGIRAFGEKIKNAVLIAAYTDKQLMFYWKTKNKEGTPKTLHELNIDLKGRLNMDNIDKDEVKEFVLSFLLEAIEDNFEALPVGHHDTKKINFSQLINKYNENLLTISICQGKVEVLKMLLRSELFNIEAEYHHKGDVKMTPARLAVNKCKHAKEMFEFESNPEALYHLLKIGSRFPNNFKVNQEELEEKCEKLKILVKELTEMHNLIKNVDERVLTSDKSDPNYDKLNQLISENNQNKFCYDINNRSLRFQAFHYRKYKLEKELSKFMELGPDESFDVVDTAKNLTQNYRQEKIESWSIKSAKNLTQPFPDSHIIELMSKSRLDNEAHNLNLDHTLTLTRVLNYLNKIDEIRPILKIVAAAKNYLIIFDRGVDNLNDRLSTVHKNTVYGTVLWSKGIITVAAKSLFKDKIMEIICGDYFKFEHIDTYPKAKNYITTIIRTLGTLAHELAHYAMVWTFKNECKPFAIDCEEEFEGILKETKKAKQNIEILSDQTRIISEVFNYQNKNCHYAELIVRPAQIYAEFSHIPDKLAELKLNYKNLFDFYDDILDKITDSIKIVEKLEDDKQEIEYVELTEDLQITLQRSIIIFQGNYVRLNDLLGNDVENATKHIKSSEIKKILNLNENLEVDVDKIAPKYYIVMRFVEKDTEKTQSDHLKIVYNDSTDFSIFKSIKSSEIKKFSDYLGDLNIKIQPKITKNDCLGSVVFKYADNDERNLKGTQKAKEEFMRSISSPSRSFGGFFTLFDLIEIAEKEKILIISNTQGNSKEITMQFIAAVLNKKYPHKYILEIKKEDLKNYKNSDFSLPPTKFDQLKDFQNTKLGNFYYEKSQLAEFLSQIIMNMSEDTFSYEFFINLFLKDQIIILWTGFYHDEIDKIVMAIKNKTNIEQWLGLHDADWCESSLTELKTFKIIKSTKDEHHAISAIAENECILNKNISNEKQRISDLHKFTDLKN